MNIAQQAVHHGREILPIKIVTPQVFSLPIVLFLCYVVGNVGIITINSIDLLQQIKLLGESVARASYVDLHSNTVAGSGVKRS